MRAVRKTHVTGGGTAEEPAVEDEALAGEQVVERMREEVGKALEDYPQSRADDAPDGRVHERTRGIVRVPSLPLELHRGELAGREERQREADPEDVDGDGTDVQVVGDQVGARV
jgi:hypothetical protein